MRCPNIYSAKRIKEWDCLTENKQFGWIPARPLYIGFRLFWRIRLAWLVFTGTCDVLGWNDKQNRS